ncbi:MAG: pyridoxal-phosphate dependent enzyme [Anaerolineales bacterium]|nr:pyridoxal-phosphate dependent enzyme [Anaerolineales bacterium]
MFDFIEEFPYQAEMLSNAPGIWRYQSNFGLPSTMHHISLEEGNTPLVWVESGDARYGKRIACKCEFMEPSGSFKDRGSALIVSFLISRGMNTALEDSSGNAGSSFAAYAARAGLRSKIFIPETTSGPKRSQIEAYGAEIVSVPGARSKATEALINVLESLQENNTPSVSYASHAYLPFNLPGYATVSYELVEQLGEAPGTVIAPVGQGGLILGIGRGFSAMKAAGQISKIPQLIGVQAEACAPLWAVSNRGAAGLAWVTEGETLAEGIRVRIPIRGDEVLKTVENSGGKFITVTESEIAMGQTWLAKNGLFVEPTSAVVWGAWSKLIEHLPEPIVAVLTGSGLKTNRNPIA